MLAIERRNAIIEKLNQEGKIIVSLVAKEFDVTEETIRRDIEKLEADGLARKTYGGAVSKQSHSSADLPYNARKRMNVEKKERIADIIAQMIKDGDRIMLDASSTSIFVTKKIKNKNNITVITNSVEILLELSDRKGWTVLSTGGTLKEGAFSLFGTSAEKMIKDHHVDYAICSSKGIDFMMGITDSNEKDSEMKRAIYSRADKKILALDSTKFNKISFVKVCDFKDVDIIVTDVYPGDDWDKRLLENNVELMF